MPDSFANRIANSLTGLGVTCNDPLLVGFSGGRDSVALVEALLCSGFEHLTLAHLDHGLRPESNKETPWIKRFAIERSLNCITDRCPVAELASQQKRGIEETARHARYAFFLKIAKEQSVKKIVLAHHADDQIETLVFRLLRGSGVDGLSAMAKKSERSHANTTLTIFRPMLAIWRHEIDEFVQTRRLAFLEDPSNATDDFTRNRIRHSLIPEMERVMRRPVRESLWRASEVLRAEAEFVAAAEAALGILPEHLQVSELKHLPLALLRRRIARWLALRGVSNINYEMVESVSRLVLHTAPAKVNLPKNAYVRRKAGRIFFEDAKPVEKKQC